MSRSVVRAAVGLGLVAASAWVAWPVEETAPEPPTITMPPEVSWTPERPGEGRLFVLRVTASTHGPLWGVHGRVGAEELHFRKVDDRHFESVAAVPVGAPSSVEASVRVVYATGAEGRIDVHVPVTPGSYRHERLTVAPRFGSPPDAADEARLAAEREKARVVAAVAHRTRPVSDGTFVMPRDSRVTSGFGDGREFNGQISSRHMGLDLRGARGDTVRAAARAEVALVDDFLLAGRLVYLNHGAGLLTAYFHLSEQLVSVGDTVEPGQPIGLVGATGRVTGPHLHWVARYGRTSVDPRSLLEVHER